MNIPCDLSVGLSWAVSLYSILLFVYAVLSWIPDLRRVMYFLAPAVEPVLAPLRRIIPPLGGFDMSFLVLILVLQFAIRPLISSLAMRACFPY